MQTPGVVLPSRTLPCTELLRRHYGLGKEFFGHCHDLGAGATTRDCVCREDSVRRTKRSSQTRCAEL
eukprot:8072038-Karenia_brevis.AAC.1